MRSGRCWMALSRLRTRASSWPRVAAAWLPRPLFMTDQAPLDRVEVRSVAGQLHHGQPVLAGLGEGAHLAADVGVEPVPDEDERGVQGAMRGADQVRVVGFGQALALA